MKRDEAIRFPPFDKNSEMVARSSLFFFYYIHWTFSGRKRQVTAASGFGFTCCNIIGYFLYLGVWHKKNPLHERLMSAQFVAVQLDE